MYGTNLGTLCLALQTNLETLTLSLLEEHQGQIGTLQEEIARYRAELSDKDNEIDMLQQELQTQKDLNSKAPTTSMKNMVTSLKNQLALKEKQHKVGIA